MKGEGYNEINLDSDNKEDFNKMIKKKMNYVIAICLLTIFLIACGTDNQKKSVDDNNSSDLISAKLLSIEDVLNYIQPLSVEGTELLKTQVGDNLIEVSEFYAEFEASKFVQNAENIDVTLLFQYECYLEDGTKEYQETVMQGTLGAEELQIVSMPLDDVDAMHSNYWTIVQAYNSEYLRLTEGRNDCWYIDDGTKINYLYGNWDQLDYLNKDIEQKEINYFKQHNSFIEEEMSEQYEIDYEWFNYYSSFFKIGTLEQLEINLQNDEIMFVTVWGNNGENLEWIFEIDSVELGEENELIYRDDSGTLLKYYSQDTNIKIETSDPVFAGWYRY